MAGRGGVKKVTVDSLQPTDDTGHVATVDIVNDGANTVKFTLTADWDNYYGTGAKITTVGFNVMGTVPGSVDSPAGGATPSFEGSTNSGSTTTNYTVKFPTSGNRLTQGEVATWKTSAAGLDASDFVAPFKLHIQSLDVPGGDGSAWIGATPVPEPGTMFALGAGALGLIRRRNKKA